MIDKELKKFVKESLKEDIQSGDQTSLACIDSKNNSSAILLAKDNGIIAGVELAIYIFNEVDSKIIVENDFIDGSIVKKGDIIMTINGNTQSILKAERLVLNCMQQMSAIATKTNNICRKISATNTKILDTRKTIPLNRKIQKWAVNIGGGKNHRFALDDMIMIKDNHIDYCGGITQAIRKTKKYLKKNNLDLDIIVETRNIKEIKEVMNEGGIRRILLDNFNFDETRNAVKIINNEYETESSGGITERNILEYAKCGVDYISLGALTHSIKNFDLSLKAK
tara:strand:- start:9785 stop:10627 length:843 start_codon:yes stop_codon:yes gene_type:complete